MLPKELRTRRIALGFSLSEFAQRAGVDPTVLLSMENGEQAVSAEVVKRLLSLEQGVSGSKPLTMD